METKRKITVWIEKLSVRKRKIENTANSPNPIPTLISTSVKIKHIKNVQMLTKLNNGCNLILLFLFVK